MRSVVRSTVFAAVVGLCAAPAMAQSRPAPSSVNESLQRQWLDIGQRIVKMAEEFPEDKYDFRPVDGVRTFGDVLRHVAFWNTYVGKAAKGEKPDPSLNELPKKDYPSKAAVVKVLKSSLADATESLKSGPASPDPKIVDLWVSFIGHSGEHYGQLVVYYRLNGIVPPASRPSAF
jgi:hypothetical protein